jgi:membrane protease YdiL (CAAX protease family)
MRWLDLLPVIAFVVLGTVLVVAVLIGIVRINRAFYRANLESISLLATLTIYLAMGTGLYLALRRLPAPLRYLGIHWPTPREFLFTLLLIVPWYIGYALVAALAAVLFNGGRQLQGNSRLIFVQQPHGVGLLLLALLVTAVAAPICEETFFRGMLLRLLRRRLPLWLAILVSAIAFGLAHASPGVSAASLPVFVYMGIVLALVYVRTHTLTNSMLLHGLNNALVTIAAFSVALR